MLLDSSLSEAEGRSRREKPKGAVEGLAKESEIRSWLSGVRYKDKRQKTKVKRQK
jgi:hypothetical protein